jgi:hypothetical protein
VTLRHAAALALLGWYLMVPPAHIANGTIQTYSDAPLSKWGIHSSYDTAKEYEKAREQVIATGQKLLQKGQGKRWGEWGSAFVLATCVASDDSRLK